MSQPRENWWAEVTAVLVKDFRSELRTKSAVSTLLMFALVSMVVVSHFVTTTGPGLTSDYVVNAQGEQELRTIAMTNARAILLSALYWIILYFSAMAALPRVFVKEEEMRTAGALRLAARPSAVFAGKLLFNTALLVTVSLLLLPLWLLFFNFQVRDWVVLVSNLVAGAAAMAGTATVIGAIVARASNRGHLMVVLGFGPLLPILILGMLGTAAGLHREYGNNLLPMVSYLVAMTTLSGLLFDRVWSD